MNRVGPLSGFLPLLLTELRPWIRTRFGLLQTAIWSGILVGGMAIPLLLLRELSSAEAGGPGLSALELHFALGALLPAFGAVILGHGMLIGERQAGTAAWILSKPVSRTAFLAAKWLALGAGLTVTAHLVPSILGYGVLALATDAPPDPIAFLAAAFMTTAVTWWAVGLTLVLGTLLASRGAVLAVGAAALVLGDVAIAVVPAIGQVGPWMLGRMAVLVAQGGPLATPWPLVATIVAALALPLLAIAAFRRQEV